MILILLLRKFKDLTAILQLNPIKYVPKVSVSTKECPYCLSRISAEEIKCPNCTIDLYDDIEEQVPVEAMFIPTKIERKTSKTRRTIHSNISAK